MPCFYPLAAQGSCTEFFADHFNLLTYLNRLGILVLNLQPLKTLENMGNQQSVINN
jgi:hypothetical protein